MKSSKLMLFIICIVFIQTTKAQENNRVKITADLVSSYVWRGVLSTVKPTPNFQPTLAYTYKGLELGVWGSTDFIGSYKEIDPYISFTKGFFKVTLTDYNWNFKTGYFNYKNDLTDHVLEGTLAYNGVNEFPLSISVATMFYGADKNYVDDSKQRFSTYVELNYPINKFNLFLGCTPTDGYYGDGYGNRSGFSIVNLGISGSKSIDITEKFALPLKATLGVNPQKEDAYLVFTLTL